MLTTEEIQRIGDTVRDVTRPQFDMVHQQLSYMHERFSYMHEQFGYMHEKFQAIDRYRAHLDAEMVTKTYLEERLARFRPDPDAF